MRNALKTVATFCCNYVATSTIVLIDPWPDGTNYNIYNHLRLYPHFTQVPQLGPLGYKLCKLCLTIIMNHGSGS